ncbi:Hsp33 family molecular chaperone HslO [Dokdonella sp.]|uniref:Hsp33 family molecular chaperone HslO n=1 Tax=Dokdonella sp. TaxID=2291710 RepID=UPI0035292035
MQELNDALFPFRLGRAGVRGSVVRLESAWAEICEHADYPQPVMQLLGESVAASALFAGALKFEGALSIHLRQAGKLRLLFAECTHDGHLRGIARQDESSDSAGIDLLDTRAQLAITIENRKSDTRYQGLVPVESPELSGAFEGYFERSEQLPSKIVLAASGGRCAGIMLQHVAVEGGTLATADPDAWNRVGHLLATLTERELLDLPVETLLLRLFHEEEVVLQPPRALSFKCSCSPERVAGMLRSLGPEEVNAALSENGKMQITCEFCNRDYQLDEVDIAALFAAHPMAPGPQSRH